MKKVLLVFLIFALAFNLAGARKKSKKAGEIDGGVFTDNKYGYSLTMSDAWDTSIKKDKDAVRIILLKKEFEIPMEYQHAPSYTKTPRVTVYADTTSLSLNQFVDMLLIDSIKCDQKKAVINEFEILWGDFIQKGRAKMTVGDVTGIRLHGQKRYTIQVQRAGSESDKADVVTDFYGGSIFFAKDGNTIVMMNMICEWRYYANEEKDFIKLINGFKFVKD